MRQLLLLLSFLTPALAQLGPPPVPAGNPITPEKALLGKALFWDDQLATGQALSCGACHAPAAGGIDPRSQAGLPFPGADLLYGTADDVFGSPAQVLTLADGHYLPESFLGFGLGPQVTRRRALPMIMAAYAPEVLWDGTATEEFLDPLTGEVVLAAGAALESQALIPLTLPQEMGHLDFAWDHLVDRIGALTPLRTAEAIPADLAAWIGDRSYDLLFEEVFGDPEVTPVRLALALATYERTLVPDQAPIDAWLAGDTTALTSLEQQGLALFESVGCADCHPAPLFTNHAYEYIGVRPPKEDRGRFYVTVVLEDMGKMRAPSLRNVELRAPYFHTGRFATLADVVGFFDRGGDFDAPNKSPLIQPLNLSAQERQALVAFLGRPLTDPRVRDELAPFDRPQVLREGDRLPVDRGGAIPNSSGDAARMIALEPPYIGNDTFTLGLRGATGGASAVLLVGGQLRGSGPFHASWDPNVQFVPVPVLSGVGDGDGYASVHLAIPLDASLLGQTITAQWVFRDSLDHLAASNVVEWTWF